MVEAIVLVQLRGRTERPRLDDHGSSSGAGVEVADAAGRSQTPVAGVSATNQRGQVQWLRRFERWSFLFGTHSGCLVVVGDTTVQTRVGVRTNH